jgi:hypothetical protein
VLTLVTLVPLVRPAGPSGPCDSLRLGGGFLALGLIHPYSAIVVAAVAVTRPVLGWLLQLPGTLAGIGVVAAGLLPAAAISDLARHPDNERIAGVLAFRVESSLTYFNVEKS